MPPTEWIDKEAAEDDADGFTHTVTHLRIFKTSAGWALDAADDSGRYSVSVWYYSAHKAAVADTGFFAEFLLEENYIFMPRNRNKEVA